MATSTIALASPSLPQHLSLDGAWRLSETQRGIDIPAIVPGVAHTDLMRAGLIPDPYFSDNEKRVQWVGDVPWHYSRQFNVSREFLANRRIVLRCEGLDTFATIRINGHHVARAENMYRTWEFDAKPYLQAGPNTIEIEFDTLANYIQSKLDRPKLFDRPVQEGGRVYARKAAFQGGWDFAPKFQPSGIWRPISLVGWDAGRIDDVRVTQSHETDGRVSLRVHLGADVAARSRVRTIVSFNGRRVSQSTAPLEAGSADATHVITRPQLWWPAGMGKPNLYDLRVELLDDEGHVIDRTDRRVGLRTVSWIPKTDRQPLALVVNGRKFFAKGSNWVPTDSLLRHDPARVRQLVQRAVDANMNLMRLWGGGYYETDTFFNACDEKGLLVWFEFGYACSPYPSFDPEWLAEARAEAADVVRRIQSHPSIAVYSGNNEVTDRIADQTSSWQMSRDEYRLLFHETLRDVVKQYAPDAAYTPGSPEVGDTHYWTVWHGSEGFDAYERLHGFMSEYGFQAVPVPRTLAQFTTPEERASFSSPGMANHQKNWRDAYNVIASMARRNYRKPKDFESMVWLGQIQQADGIVSGIEHWRRDWPNSTASLVWQYNDPWPGSSWSMIDYYNRPKALLYRIRHAYAPVALSGTALESGMAELWVANDRARKATGRIDWTLMRLDGTVLRHGSETVAIPAGTSSTRVSDLDFGPEIAKSGKENVLVFAALQVTGEPDSTTVLRFTKTKALELQDPAISVDAQPISGGFRVTLTCRRPAISAWLDLPDVDAEFSDNFVDLMPGEKAVIEVRPAFRMSVADLKRTLVVRSLYDTYLPGTEADPTVRPQPDGRIVALAEDADIQGNGPVLELGNPSNIGNWRSTDNTLVWRVRGAMPGQYRVVALISVPESDAGGTYEVEIEGQRLSATVTATKGWTDYVEFDLGVVSLRGGDTTINVRPLTKPHDNLMNLRSVALKPL